MSSEAERAHSALELKVAEKYRKQGFDVVLQPQEGDLPFDLGTYRPDLIAKRPPSENYIIEVKGFATRTPIDRYRHIAETVSQHAGWRFLLVTGEDIPSNEQHNGGDELLSWEQMRERQAKAERLLSQGETEAAFLSLWGILEGALRRRAIEVSIPIERFPTLSLINQLYSHGELSIEQFDRAKALQTIRNSFVHGYQTPSLSEPVMQLQEMLKVLLESWASQ